MSTLEIILLFILLNIIIIIVGLIYEKARHHEYNGAQVVFQFKRDLKSILKAFFTKPKSRFQFDWIFTEEIKGLLNEYSHPEFEISVSPGYLDNEKVPFLFIQFKPKKTPNDEECREIANLIMLKFRSHLYSNMYSWRNFIYHSIGKDYIRFFVYYEELPEDKKGFEKKYNILLRQNENNPCGLIEDEQLNREICHVDKTGMVAERLGKGD